VKKAKTLYAIVKENGDIADYLQTVSNSFDEIRRSGKSPSDRIAVFKEVVSKRFKIKKTLKDEAIKFLLSYKGETSKVSKSGFPLNTKIPEKFIIRHKGFLRGPIFVGDVFAWEPYKQSLRELVVVTSVEKGCILSERVNGPESTEVWSSEHRFREACYRTRFNVEKHS
jgi:hypothetical protein